MASNGVLARLRFTGETTRLHGLTVRHGGVYRVLMVGGCGHFRVRVYDVESPKRFADCEYCNLAAFLEDWGVC